MFCGCGKELSNLWKQLGGLQKGANIRLNTFFKLERVVEVSLRNKIDLDFSYLEIVSGTIISETQRFVKM